MRQNLLEHMPSTLQQQNNSAISHFFLKKIASMRLLSLFSGILITVFLLGILLLARSMHLHGEPQALLTLTEVSIAPLPEPPPPPPEEPPLEEETPPPPPPSLENLLPSPDPSIPEVPVVDTPHKPTLGLETFFSDNNPAPLPRVQVSRPTKKTIVKAKPRTPVRRHRPRPKPPVKSSYSAGELDSKPRVVYHPRVRFPSSIHNASSGKVVVVVRIDPRGKSHFISIRSSTHSALAPIARRIANQSRFTPPLHRGKPVTATMIWPITIKR